MNGRVYDPFLGRMLSADPTVPGEFNSQAFNRFSYVFNNPLSLSDPSGFAPGVKYVDGGGGSDPGVIVDTSGCMNGGSTSCRATDPPPVYRGGHSPIDMANGTYVPSVHYVTVTGIDIMTGATVRVSIPSSLTTISGSSPSAFSSTNVLSGISGGAQLTSNNSPTTLDLRNAANLNVASFSDCETAVQLGIGAGFVLAAGAVFVLTQPESSLFFGASFLSDVSLGGVLGAGVIGSWSLAACSAVNFYDDDGRP